jgi:N-acetylmuramic acid 6-phosphate etherase
MPATPHRGGERRLPLPFLVIELIWRRAFQKKFIFLPGSGSERFLPTLAGFALRGDDEFRIFNSQFDCVAEPALLDQRFRDTNAARIANTNQLGVHNYIVGTNSIRYPRERTLLENLLTEQPNPASANIDALSTGEMLRVINAEDRKVAEAVEREIPSIAHAVDAIAAAFQHGGRLFYIGAGTSGRLGVLDASECPPTFGVAPDLVQGIIAGGEAALSRATETTEDDPSIGARDLTARGFTANDILTGIAASGRTPYVLGAVAEAKRLGATTIGVSCTPNSELARAVDIAITPLVGPEVIAGSTRMKAGTAQKLVLNMLTTGAFVRMGYVYGNLMVNVQPKNSKLRDRAKRIIAQAAGVSYERAGQLLNEAGDRVPEAIRKGLRDSNG